MSLIRSGTPSGGDHLSEDKLLRGHIATPFQGVQIPVPNTQGSCVTLGFEIGALKGFGEVFCLFPSEEDDGISTKCAPQPGARVRILSV